MNNEKMDYENQPQRAYGSDEEGIREQIDGAEKIKIEAETRIKELYFELGVELMKQASNKIIESIK